MTSTCYFCGGDYLDEEDVSGCCSVRCALDSMSIGECPACQNHGVMEVSPDPERSEVEPCIHGCDENDWWVKETKEFRHTPAYQVTLPLDNSDIPF